MMASVITPNRAELQQVVGGWHDDAQLREKAQRLREEAAVDLLAERDAFAALFALNMLLTSERGGCHADVDHVAWLEATGFTDAEIIRPTAELTSAGTASRRRACRRAPRWRAPGHAAP